MTRSGLERELLLERELWHRECRDSLLAWCIEALAPFGFQPAAHHRLLIRELEAVAHGHNDRLMIFMPPGSAKSTYVSKLFPAWLMARGGLAVIGASHTTTLAQDFSKDVQRFSTQHADVLGYQPTTPRADLWRTTNGCQYRAVGVDAGISGIRGDVAVIDDPIRGRADADSETKRESVWKWFQADLGPRMKPGGRIILMHCMTGDTLVMMADGTETPLRDIRPGDAISTYRDGSLSTSRVVNWINQGPDQVYKIRTTSGTIVKANERHPFLVRVGEELKWIKLKDLRLGHEIVRVKRGNGRARVAPGMGASNPFQRVVTASLTTIKNAGRMAFVHLRLVQPVGEPPRSKPVTACPSRIMSVGWSSRAGFARFAGNRPGRTCAPIGAGNCVSIIATIRGVFARCFATTATSPLGMSKQPKLRMHSRRTCDFMLDPIVEIRPAGTEDVFDIQVAETENFIANGLVSHNTRWHEDDLAGRILQTQGERWRVLNLPAIATTEDDPLGRAIGEPLWADDAYGYGAELAAKREAFERDGATREWASLYQQNPRPNEGALFRTAMVTVVDAAPPLTTACRGWDFAATAATGTRDPDWTVGLKLGRCADGRYIILDVARLRGDPAEVDTALKSVSSQDGTGVPISLPQDPGAAGKSRALYQAQLLSGHTVHVSPETGDKATRAAPVASQVNIGNMLMLRAPWNRALLDELGAFPSGAKDDQVDALSRAFAYLNQARAPMRVDRSVVEHFRRRM